MRRAYFTTFRREEEAREGRREGGSRGANFLGVKIIIKVAKTAEARPGQGRPRRAKPSGARKRENKSVISVFILSAGDAIKANDERASEEEEEEEATQYQTRDERVPLGLPSSKSVEFQVFSAENASAFCCLGPFPSAKERRRRTNVGRREKSVRFPAQKKMR